MAERRADKDEREFVTSEGIDLRLRLGTVGARFGAWLLDVVIMMAALIVLTIVALMLFGVQDDITKQLIVAIWLLGAFVLRNGYFIAFELGMRAATPGKRAMRLRVVARDGGRLTGEAVVARNVMRELELYLPLSFMVMNAQMELADSATSLAGLAWTGTFLLFPLLNRDRLRVGDLIAGTWVVRLPVKRLGASVAAQHFIPDFVFTDAQLNAYGEFELQKLEEVLRREDDLSLMVVARTIRARIGWTGPVGDDYQFLQSYYAALCQRLERNMLFGKRRRDKHEAA
jgi:uncharacterized RDD family membrane protein YckC